MQDYLSLCPFFAQLVKLLGSLYIGCFEGEIEKSNVESCDIAMLAQLENIKGEVNATTLSIVKTSDSAGKLHFDPAAHSAPETDGELSSPGDRIFLPGTLPGFYRCGYLPAQGKRGRALDSPIGRLSCMFVQPVMTICSAWCQAPEGSNSITRTRDPVSQSYRPPDSYLNNSNG